MSYDSYGPSAKNSILRTILVCFILVIIFLLKLKSVEHFVLILRPVMN